MRSIAIIIVLGSIALGLDFFQLVISFIGSPDTVWIILFGITVSVVLAVIFRLRWLIVIGQNIISVIFAIRVWQYFNSPNSVYSFSIIELLVPMALLTVNNFLAVLIARAIPDRGQNWSVDE